MRNFLACSAITAVAALGAGCPSISVDPGEGSGELTAGPTVEFDPANSIIPFPNNLLISPTTGKVTLPQQCNESPVQAALRTGVLNTLDGFGTFEVAIQATFSANVGSASLTASNVQLYQRASNGSALDPATATPVPTIVHSLGAFPRYEADCQTVDMVETMTLVPLVPLEQKSTYTVALLAGITDENGSAFEPSFTWSLVRQAVDPVTLGSDGSVVSESTPLDPSSGSAAIAQLQGIDLLWKAHEPALTFLDKVPAVGSDRSKVLLAWDFNTATVTDPIDAHIATSVAGSVSKDPLFDAGSQLGGATPLQFLNATAIAPLCTTNAAGSAQPGGYIPCNAVGDIQGALLTEDIYQTDSPNAFSPNNPIPGPWNDPYTPTVVHKNAQIKTIIMIPTGTPPAAGWPTIIYGHGLGSRKETLVAIGPQLAARGFASVGIDWVDHGDRAVQITAAAALGCDGAQLDPSESPQCFVPFLGADLATDRDNVRQSVVDVHRLHAALVACKPPLAVNSACGTFTVDPDKIGYIGISLGGILGSTFASTADLKAATLNVSGVGLVDILENTPNLTIACSLVDSLIDAGVLTGDKSNLAASPPTGLCTTHAWLAQPGYQTFAGAARWILDPADGANFTSKLAHQKMFLQEVVNDQVVPNIATDDEGALVGLAPAAADIEATGGEPPSAALATITVNHWVRYTDLPADATTHFPGNGFQHASLLSPDTSISITAGILGTIRVQTDALAFLVGNVL